MDEAWLSDFDDIEFEEGSYIITPEETKMNMQHADEEHKQHMKHRDELHKQHMRHREEAHKHNMHVAKTTGLFYMPMPVGGGGLSTPTPPPVAPPPAAAPSGS